MPSSAPRVPIPTDYLVLGAGVDGLSFVDALLAQDHVCNVIIADRHSHPGGWVNDAPIFARFAASDTQFGVLSRRLDKAASAQHASRNEILVHLEHVMRNLLSTGRVRYFPKHVANDDGTSLTNVLDSDCSFCVDVKRKVVHAAGLAHFNSSGLDVAEGVSVLLASRLPDVTSPHSMYMVVGSGCCAVDTVLWLLSCGVLPEKVSWVKPEELWFKKQEALLSDRLANSLLTLVGLQATCRSLRSLYHQLEQADIICRLDRTREPDGFHCSILSTEELAALRTVRDVIRLGHVQRFSKGRLVLSGGVLDVPPGTLCIDCTTAPLKGPERPKYVWSGSRIVVQEVLEARLVGGGLSLSAATLGTLEGKFPEEPDLKNALCRVPFPSDAAADFCIRAPEPLANAHLWKAANLGLWWQTCPLNPLATMPAVELHRLAQAVGERAEAARNNLVQLLGPPREAASTLQVASPCGSQSKRLSSSRPASCATTAPPSPAGARSAEDEAARGLAADAPDAAFDCVWPAGEWGAASG